MGWFVWPGAALAGDSILLRDLLQVGFEGGELDMGKLLTVAPDRLAGNAPHLGDFSPIVDD